MITPHIHYFDIFFLNYNDLFDIYYGQKTEINQ